MLLSLYAEVVEHTTLQKAVPLDRQRRVFGFAQSVEQSASPVTTFLIGPLTQFVVIPFMTDGQGCNLSAASSASVPTGTSCWSSPWSGRSVYW